MTRRQVDRDRSGACWIGNVHLKIVLDVIKDTAR